MLLQMVLFCYYLWLSSTLAWKIPWTEEPSRLQSMGSQRVRHDWAAHFCFSLSCIGEGNSNILQWSCLENPRDGGALWAAMYGVVQSRTRLKWLSSGSSSILLCMCVCIYTHTHITLSILLLPDICQDRQMPRHAKTDMSWLMAI